MPFTTSQALAGFVVTEPKLSPEGASIRLDMTVGQARWHTLDDGTLVRANPDTCHLVMHGVPAMRAAGQFRVGDCFIADGQMAIEHHENLVTGETRDEPIFEATRIGPDTAALSYQHLFARRAAPIRPPAVDMSVPAPIRRPPAVGL